MSSERDDLFAQLAVERGHLTSDEVDTGRRAQRGLAKLGRRVSLAKVLYTKELLTKEQVRELNRYAAIQTGEASRVGGYEVLARVGTGGMGVVYRARKLSSGEVVALKVLPPSAATEAIVERFKREADVGSHLGHENIVEFLELGYDERHRCHYCVLEFIEGEDLGRRIKRHGKLSEKEAVSVARQIAEALEHAWSQGLIHGDVKPKNIMLTPDGHAKLLDLGLARPPDLEEARPDGARVFLGTASYASPEQARGETKLDTRSDIYSLGATLYHCATGRPPFTGRSSIAVLRKHVSERLRPPTEVAPELSDEFCQLIHVMMAKDPGDRYDDPTVLLKDLETFSPD
ncbi:MAG: serine/threonine protein kinase [Planctomycetota bacterium]|jgi:serine/threonine-protein kinase